VVVLGEILSNPQLLPDGDNPYWVESPPPDQLRERVLVRYVVPEQLPLWEPDPVLEGVSVSRARGGTVFRVAPEQWDALVDRAGSLPLPRAGDPPSVHFVPRQRYRRAALHDRHGGQRQGGISTPAGSPIVLLFSSPRGADYGYQDGWTAEGLYLYTGEGQRGDMALTRGNAAVLNHADEGRDLHLFEPVGRGVVEYIGRLVCVGSEWRLGTDLDGRTCKAIVFALAPAEEFAVGARPPNLDLMGVDAIIDGSLDLAALRALALEPASSGPVPAAERVRRVWLRSQAVRLYAQRRAQGVCEGCGSPAPFVTLEGEPYLEVHYLRRLSDGGPDHPARVAALCPNCHRRCHHSVDAAAFNSEVGRRVWDGEAALGFSIP
jgi:5-methylcytosine-specific restriction protein A